MLNLKTLGTLATAAAFATATLVAQTAKPKPAQGDAPKSAEAKPATAKPAGKHVVVTTGDIKWGPAPDSLPPGAQMAVLDGDPGKPAPFVVRAKFPDGYKVMPHYHPADESITVLSGTFMAGMGDTWNDASMTTLKAGEFAKMPKQMHHYAGSKGETIIQIHGTGPFAITYVNPKDDPRKKSTQ